MPPIDRIDRRTDVVLILFRLAKEVKGVTKLQKLLFLIEQETEFFEEYESEVAFKFAPYRMGPFSKEVYSEIRFLLELGAITQEPWTGAPAAMESVDLGHKRFVVTSKGEKIGHQLYEILEADYQTELEEIVEEYNDLPLRELLRYVYTEYPDYATESEIVDSVFAKGDA